MGGPFLYIKINGDKESIADIFIAIATIVCSAFYFVMSRIQIHIDNDGIVLKTLLSINSMEWKHVKSSKLSFEVHAHSGDIKWIIANENGEGLRISPTYFSRKDNQFIAEALLAKCKCANISDKITNMAAGRFPWYIF